MEPAIWTQPESEPIHLSVLKQQVSLSHLDLTAGGGRTPSLLRLQVLREQRSDERTDKIHAYVTLTVIVRTYCILLIPDPNIDLVPTWTLKPGLNLNHLKAELFSLRWFWTYNSLPCISSMMSLNNTSLFLSQKPLTSYDTWAGRQTGRQLLNVCDRQVSRCTGVLSTFPA